jgi:histidyl-tRNA synthetase
MRVMDCKVDGSKPFVLDAPVISDHLCDACRDHFEAVRRTLDEAGITFEHDRHLVRGLDYYTRTAFEFVSSALPAAQAATICAGGRYDGLAETLGGPPTPGVGFALGLDRVLLAVEAEGATPPPERAPACFVVAIGDEAGPVGRSLLADLRSAGVPSAAPYEERPLKAQLKMAARSGAAFVAIVGGRETADGTVTLRRLVDGVQKSVPRGDVVSWLTRLDGWTE